MWLKRKYKAKLASASTKQPAFVNMADKSDSQDKDVDELDDDFGSDDENADPNVFRISGALTPPSAISYSAKELHSELTGDLG